LIHERVLVEVGIEQYQLSYWYCNSLPLVHSAEKTGPDLRSLKSHRGGDFRQGRRLSNTW
jgi:hypothetical protein